MGRTATVELLPPGAGADAAPVAASGGRRPGLRTWLVAAPLGLWLLLFVVAPNALIVACAFCRSDDLGQVVWSPSLEGFRRMLDPAYFRIVLASVGWAALATAICLAAGYPVAWFIGRSPTRRRNRLLTLVMIPFWTSFLIRAYGWITVLKSEGVLAAFLRSAGIVSGPLELLYTPAAVVIGLVHSYLPFMILPLVGSIEKLDPALLEAAADLGAPPRRTFFRVMLPLTRPGIDAGVLMVFVPAIGMFAVTDLLGGARVPLIGNVIQTQFGAGRDWPFGAALATVLLALFALCGWLLARRRAPA